MSKDISEIILEELREFRKDMHNRVGKVEMWQSNVDGKITVFGLFCAAIGSFVVWMTNILHR